MKRHWTLKEIEADWLLLPDERTLLANKPVVGTKHPKWVSQAGGFSRTDVRLSYH